MPRPGTIELENDGYCLLRGAYSEQEVADLLADLTLALETASQDTGAIRSRGGRIYAARNMIALFPRVAQIWQRESLTGTLSGILGNEFGLVRVLYFDKPPEQSWSLPWHKDLTIAVERNDLPSTQFANPTNKAGIPHVEAPQAVLESMLTVRIHLDHVTEDNGPLLVLPGSHRSGKECEPSPRNMQPILAEAGDVLVMRPLLAHSSGNSAPDTTLHRRIVHLEFAARQDLPDGYRWRYYQRWAADR